MKRDSIRRPLVLAFVLGVGIATVWAAVGALSGTMVSQFNYKPPLRQSLIIRADGTPLIRSYTDNYRDATFETLEGQPVPFDESESQLSGASLPSGVRKGSFFLRHPWNRRIRSFSDGKKPETYWYFMHDGRQDGAGYFVGYHRKTKQQVGYIGMAGFADTQPPRELWFSIDGRDYPYGDAILSSQSSYQLIPNYYDAYLLAWKINLRCGSKLLEVDLRKHTVKTIFEDSELASIGNILRETKDAGLRYQHDLAARVKGRIVLFDLEGKEIDSYAIPEKLRRTDLQVHFLPNEQALLVSTDQIRSRAVEIDMLYWVDRKGKILDEKQVTLAGHGSPVSVEKATWNGAGLFPVPGILVPGLIVFAPLAEMEMSETKTYGEGMRKALPKIWPALFVVTLLGIVLAVLTVRRQKRFGLGRQKTWAAFVFLFGVPGYLAYLCHRRWPVREECAECHTQAPRDREACPFCDTPFPDPAPKGCEVFA